MLARIACGAIVVAASALSSCSVMPPEAFPRADRVDMERFAGTWYVIAHIPPWLTEEAYNAVEHYELTETGGVNVVFTYRDGGFDGERERMTMKGEVLERTGNTVWAMRPFWPLAFENTISYVSPDYQTTIVARSARDYVWVMAREPRIRDNTYADLIDRVEALGYDPQALRRVPQQPLDARDDAP